MLDGHPRTCSNGIPLASHRRCVVCGCLLGCQGEEPPADSDPRLCAPCWQEGRRILIRHLGSRYLKPAEVAAVLGCSHISILRLIRQGELPAVRLRRAKNPNGFRYLVPRKALDAYLNSLATTPAADAPSTGRD
jgi:excisionase family DNA binding protein